MRRNIQNMTCRPVIWIWKHLEPFAVYEFSLVIVENVYSYINDIVGCSSPGDNKISNSLE